MAKVQKDVGQTEGAEGAAEKVKTEFVVVEMADGRKVTFTGKRKMLKDVVKSENSVAVRFDFKNGETRLFEVPVSLALDFMGHGASQKIGDEASGIEELDDIIIAVDDIIARLNKGEWGATRAAGDGFSGASVVIRAIMESTGKSQDDVKAFLQGKLDKAKDAGQKLTRADLYAAFRNPTTKTGAIIERIEREKKSKSSVVNADDLLGELV